MRRGWLVAVGMLGIAGLLGCETRNVFVPPPPPEVTVAQPVEQLVQEYFHTTGQTVASSVVELRARVSGYLKEIHFKDGALVEEGDLLFIIDKAPYETAAASARAALAKAEAQLKLAERQLERTQRLVSQNAATANDLDIQRAEQATAVANVAAGRAALDEATLNLEYTEIRAPFSGRMGRHLVDVGNLVNTGETMLATLEAVDPIYASFTLNETDLLRFMEMQRQGEIKISDADPITIELSLADREDYRFQGKLDFREFGIDPSTGTTLRRAIYPNADATLIPGLFVKVRAAVGEPRPRLLVEERAISADQRGEFVMIVNEDNRVEQRMVRLGLLRGGMRVVEAGLRGGERVVVVGLQRARLGSEVVPKEVAMGSEMNGSAVAAAGSVPAADNPSSTEAASDAAAEPSSDAAPSSESAAATGVAAEDDESTTSSEAGSPRETGSPSPSEGPAEPAAPRDAAAPSDSTTPAADGAFPEATRTDNGSAPASPSAAPPAAPAPSPAPQQNTPPPPPPGAAQTAA